MCHSIINNIGLLPSYVRFLSLFGTLYSVIQLQHIFFYSLEHYNKLYEFKDQVF